jgi:hypothetical protein
MIGIEQIAAERKAGAPITAEIDRLLRLDKKE